ncbi:MAG: SdrD B-like domain-containing protein, partial [Bacteroidota bacterium]
MDPNLDPNREQGHDETSLGGIFVHNGQLNLFTSVYDPLNDWNLPFNNAGLIRLSTVTGERNGGNQIYATPTDPGTFAKGNGLGDMEGVGGAAPIELGNRVWLDVNANGRQDPGEGGINGVTVELYKNINGNLTKVAETTTAADAVQGDGAFVFSASPAQSWMGGETRVEAEMDYEIRVDLADVQAANVLVTSFTSVGAIMTNDPVTDVNDSDASAVGVIAFSTNGAGENNHGLDIGVLEGPPCVVPTTDAPTTAEGTCGNGVFNDDASAALTNVTNGTEAGIVAGTDYDIASGPAFGDLSNVDVSGGAGTFTDLLNNTTYTIRIFNGSNGCFVDVTVTTPNTDCTVICEEKRLDWDVEDWLAGTTNATFPIGLTNVTIDVQAAGFGTYEREEPIEGGFALIETDLPDDTEAFDAAQAMIGDGEALELKLSTTGDMTVSLDFTITVSGLMFSVLDLDAAESVTIIAENNGTPVVATLTAANGAGPMIVGGNIATGGGTNSDNDSDGTLDVTFNDDVDAVTLTFSSTSRVALSDLKICDAGMSLGNLVWNDVDNDGLVDVTGEPGLPNVAMKLFKDENSDGLPDDTDPIASTMTDGDGHYLFDDLNRGKYLVWIDSTNF